LWGWESSATAATCSRLPLAAVAAATAVTAAAAATATTEAAHASQLDVGEQHRRLSERFANLVGIHHRGHRGRRRRDRGNWRRLSGGHGGGLLRGLGRLVGGREIHQVFDALAELGRHELHALTELARQRLRFALRRLAERRGVVPVAEQRHGAKRHHRQQEERDDEAKAKAHEKVAITGA
jgi:hypothetical protein